MPRRLVLFLLLTLSVAFSPFALGKSTDAPRVHIAEAYLELHTGPGRGYPVFHVVKRGQQVTVLKRRTDWFLIRTDDQLEGWATRKEMELTLTEAGGVIEFRDVLVDTVLHDRLSFGLSGGSMEGQTVMGLRAVYGLNEFLSSELTISQVSGSYTSTQVYSLHLLTHPARKGRFAPFLSLGFGQFRDNPRKTLVDPQESNSPTAIVGFGVNTYLTKRFMMRIDYRNFVILVGDDSTREFDEVTGGFSFAF